VVDSRKLVSGDSEPVSVNGTELKVGKSLHILKELERLRGCAAMEKYKKGIRRTKTGEDGANYQTNPRSSLFSMFRFKCILALAVGWVLVTGDEDLRHCNRIKEV
jgi:hypothetical protein